MVYPSTSNFDPELLMDLLLDSHHRGLAENDISVRIRDLITRSGIAGLNEVEMEFHPEDSDARRVDIYVRNTFIEVKRDILSDLGRNLEQLDDYLEIAAKAGRGIQNGILTDGKTWQERHVGDKYAVLVPARLQTTFETKEQGIRLVEFLREIIDIEAQDIRPDHSNLIRFLGFDSPLYRAAIGLLGSNFAANKNNPTVAVKRRLWQDLLQVALGKDAANDGGESDWLFIRHTYITTLVSLIVQQQLGIDVRREVDNNADELLKGGVLENITGLQGIVDTELFAWPLEVGDEQNYLKQMSREVSRFNWDHDASDVAPTLYQSIISPDERRDLGEYYTPTWLADAITERIWDSPDTQRILDPSCGSGTFIESAVKHLLAHSEQTSAVERLELLQNNIRGIDIHPVAVQLAKATWVMASAETIRTARFESGTAMPPVTAPIYLGDSMQLRYDTGNLEASQFLQLKTGEISGDDEVVFNIPKSLARRHSEFDRVVAYLAHAVDSGEDARLGLRNFEFSEDERSGMETVFDQMRQLHEINRNHVWAYYIRNMTRPAMISENKVDRIVGNPPWLKYADTSDIIRQELRDMSADRYQIWEGRHLAPHQEVATLFYIRVVELYLKPEGIIGMVMPHSVLRLSHHKKFRTGRYVRNRRGRRNVPSYILNFDFRDMSPWDLDGLVPNSFFRLPSSVVFSTFRGQEDERVRSRALAPGTVEMWRGPTNSRYVERAIEALNHDDGQFHSPYANMARQGPTLVDRRLLFVEEVPHGSPLALPTTINTVIRRSRQDQITYEGAEYIQQIERLENQPISRNHIFDVYLGDCLAPYSLLKPWQAALPAFRDSMTIPMNHDDCPLNEEGEVQHTGCRLEVDALDRTMSRRWRIVSEMFRAQHVQGSITELTENIDHLGKLSSQLATCRYLIEKQDDNDIPSEEKPVRVAYTTSGQPVAAVIEDHHSIVESKLYQIVCRNKAEANYVSAILNSEALYNSTEQFMSRGQFGGARDLHRHCWKLPIPRYDADNPLHASLSTLGQIASSLCREQVEPLIRVRSNAAGQSNTPRRILRHQWRPISPVAQTIERRVKGLLNAIPVE